MDGGLADSRKLGEKALQPEIKKIDETRKQA